MTHDDRQVCGVTVTAVVGGCATSASSCVKTEIDTLIRRGFLQAETRNDRNAVTRALYAYFDRALGSVR